MGIQEEFLTLDSLGVKADDVFHRFDTLNSKYKPFGMRTSNPYFYLHIQGSGELQNLFLRRTNEMEGRYFAELIKEVFSSNEKLNVHTEIGISVYGRKVTDWDYLGWWIHSHNVDSPNNR